MSIGISQNEISRKDFQASFRPDPGKVWITLNLQVERNERFDRCVNFGQIDSNKKNPGQWDLPFPLPRPIDQADNSNSKFPNPKDPITPRDLYLLEHPTLLIFKTMYSFNPTLHTPAEGSIRVKPDEPGLQPIQTRRNRAPTKPDRPPIPTPP